MRGRIVLLGLLAALLGGIAWWAGVFEHLDPEAGATLLREWEPWSPIAFVLLLSLANGLGSPAAFFVLPAIAVWSPIKAFVVIWCGSIGAGLVGYAFARKVGRAWVEPRLPLALRNLDERIAQNELRTVLLVRVSLYLLAPSHWALGLSSVRPLPLVVGTVIGFAPFSALWAFAGGSMIESMREGSSTVWIVLGVILLAAFVLPRWRARRRAARAEE